MLRNIGHSSFRRSLSGLRFRQTRGHAAHAAARTGCSTEKSEPSNGLPIGHGNDVIARERTIFSGITSIRSRKTRIMAIEFYCGTCNKLLRTSDDRAGVRAKCPQCGESIMVPMPDQSVPPEEDYEDYADDEIDPGDSAVERDDAEENPYQTAPALPSTKVCQMCGETIDASAKVCRFCGEEQRGGRRRSSSIPEEVDVGDVFSTSWELFKSEMGVCVGATVIFVVIILVVSVGFEFVFSQMRQNVGNQALIGFLGIQIIAQIVQSLLQWYLQIGFTILFLNIARGESAEIGDLFSGGPYFLRMIGNSFLFSLMIVVGFVACIIPGIILVLMFWPYVYVLVDRDSRGIGCLAESKDITQGTWLPLFLIYLVSAVINFLGVCAACVGLLFTIPWTQLMLSVAYCRMTGQQTAADEMS